MPQNYVDLSVLKLSLNMSDADVSRDELFNQAISAACRLIDQETGRRFSLDADVSQRIFRPDCGNDLLVVDDIATTTGLVVETGLADAGQWVAVTDFETSPLNAEAWGRPITALRRVGIDWGNPAYARVRVTAQWGWPAVPEEVVQAALIQASRLFKRKDSPEGVMGSAEWGFARVTRVDPDVRALIQHLAVPGF